MDDLTQLPGVGPTTAEKLKEAGYTDFMKIATVPSAIEKDCSKPFK